MKKILSILVLASVVLTSCKKEETTDSAPPEETAADTTAVAAGTTGATVSTPQVQAGASNSVMTQPGAAASYSTAVPATAKGMNPPHGQPGHRCDIAVGAPLNSPPGNKTIQPTVTQATTVTPAMVNTVNSAEPTKTKLNPVPAAPVVTAPGMNPPHGQEGHVCSVPVGEPLPKKE